MEKRDDEPLPGPSPEALLALRLIPKVGEALARYAIDRHHRRLKRAAELLNVAADETGVAPEELVVTISASERLSDLLNEALQAAANSGLESKRRALGRVLAQAIAGDDAKIDASALIVASLAHLEPIHVRIMARMYRKLDNGRVFSQKVDPTEFDTAGDIQPAVAQAAILQLQAWGLATSNLNLRGVIDNLGSDFPPSNSDYKEKFQLTRHGLELIELLEVTEAGEEA